MRCYSRNCFILRFCRVGKQRLRESRIQAVDYLILLLAGACLGSLAKVNDQNFGAPGYTYTIIAVCKFKAMIVVLDYIERELLKLNLNLIGK